MCDGCGAKIAQILLFIFNFLVWVVGIILIAVGAYVLIKSDDYAIYFGDANALQTVAGFTIGVGVIILIVGFCGCCGAVKKNTILLKIYFALVLLVIILEIVAGILAFVYQNEVTDLITDELEDIIKEKYNCNDTNVFTKAINELQQSLKCCGADGPEDWVNNTCIRNSGNAVPVSCCKKETPGCNVGVNPDIYKEGCVDKLIMDIESNYLTVGAVCLALLVFEILALIFTCCLIRAKDEDKQI